MFGKKKDCARDLLAATNPFSIHRKTQVLRWILFFGVLFCAAFAVGLYYLNNIRQFGR